jgi:hypothetical protein
MQTGDTKFLKQLGWCCHFHSFFFFFFFFFFFQRRATQKQQVKRAAGFGKDKGTSFNLPSISGAKGALLRQTPVSTL